jgi:hypothetical protein
VRSSRKLFLHCTALVGFGVLLLPTTLNATVCVGNPTLERQFQDAKAVFVAEVISTDFGSQVLSVQERFKGNTNKMVRHFQSGWSSDISFSKGRYIVFATSVSRDGETIRVNICNGTRLYDLSVVERLRAISTRVAKEQEAPKGSSPKTEK